MTWVLVSGRELNCGVSERTLTKLSGLGKLCLGLSSTGGISALLAMSTELVATMRTLTAPATVTAGAMTYAASFNRNGELVSGKNSDVTTQARPSCSAEYALPSQRSLLGPGPNCHHGPACAEFAPACLIKTCC